MTNNYQEFVTYRFLKRISCNNVLYNITCFNSFDCKTPNSVRQQSDKRPMFTTCMYVQPQVYLLLTWKNLEKNRCS